jgi:glycosyltransferase involved in cell wall biosynthesis
MLLDVSVIVPSYNRVAMLRDAVASVLAQGGVRFELIVVDDGSIDGTREEMEQLISSARAANCAASIHFLRHERNRGVAAARNTGASLATAPLLAFLDSDDLWAPEKLSRQLQFFAHNPRCEIAQTEEVWIRDGVRVNPGRRHRKRAGDCFIDSLRTCLLSPSATMMRTHLFRRVGGFDEDLIAAEDYDLWLRIMVDCEIGLLDESLVTRRAGHPGQLSASVAAIDRFRIVALLKLLKTSGLSEARRAAIAGALTEKARIYAAGLRRRGHFSAANLMEEIMESAPAWIERADPRLTEIVELIRKMIKNSSASGTSFQTQ